MDRFGGNRRSWQLGEAVELVAGGDAKPGEWQLRAVIAAVTLVIGMAVAVLTLRMSITCWSAVPLGDQWDELVSGRQVSWEWLLAQHVEHRLVFPRLVFIADYLWFGEANRLNYAVNLAIQGGMAGVLLFLAHRCGMRARVELAWAAGLCLGVVFWAGQYQNFVWGFQPQFFGVTLAAAASFVLLACVEGVAAALVLSMLVQIVAVYTMASGVVVPVLCIGLAFLVRRPRWTVVAQTAWAALLIAGYLWGYQTPPENAHMFGAWRQFDQILLYVLLELGAPLSNFVLLHMPLAVGFVVSAGAGAVGLLSFLKLGTDAVLHRNEIVPGRAALLALASFVVAMFSLTAIGRLRNGIVSALLSRYTSPSVIFWICLIFLVATRNRRQSVGAHWMAAALGLVALLGLTQADNMRLARQWVGQRRAVEPALLANVDDPGLFAQIYPGDLSHLRDHLGALRTAHKSVFAADWGSWLGERLVDHVVRTDNQLCGGTIDQAMRVQDTPAGWRLRGQGWRQDGDALERLLVVDQAGLVVGYGLARVSLPAIASDSAGRQWVAEWRQVPPDMIKVYALIGPAPVACRIGGG